MDYIEHSVEPEVGTVIEVTPELKANGGWRYSEVSYQYTAQCNFCGAAIESNEPDYQWFHI